MMHKKPIWNDNPFDQWREEELLCMEKGSICYGKGGGGQQQPSQPAVTTQVQQSEFPTELKPFIEDIFGKAQAIQQSKQAEGFQAFQGPLQSGFDPAQTRAFAQIEALPGATRPLFDEATTLAQSASGPAATAEEVQAASNPFVRNVIDIQKREAERVSDVQGQRQDAAAAQAGAFGGSRAAILEAERQRNLNQQLGDIESQGQLAAFQDAQQRLAQQRQFEASGATQLAALGSAIPAQQLKELGALSGVGAARQTQAQRGIDLARQEFEAEEAFPSQTLQEFSSVLRGFPIAPTRSTSTQQFSAAQPLSTQLLGVGTQALGALGSAGALKGAFGQAGGAVGRMPVQKYQGGGALNSLIQNVEGYDTQPVIGMKRGGSFMEQMLSGGILSTDKAQDMMRKNPKITGMLGGAGLPALLGALQPDAPPAQAAPTVTQEDIDKQINAALRQRAAQGQQAAAAGAPRAQGSSQVGNQVRQPFKEGGGLSQMVRLPSNRVQFGKAAYADVTEEQTFLDEVNRFKGLGRLFRPGINSPMMLFPPSAAPVTYANTGTSSVDSPAIRQAETAAHLERLGPNMMVEEMGPVAQIGEASVRLGGGRSEVDGAAELDIAPAPTALASKPKASGPPAPAPKPTPTAEEVKLYREPEEAAYGSLIDGGYFKDKTPMINKQNNTALSNISEGLRAYKGFKDAEMSQRQKINAANLKAAASTRAIEKDRLGRALTQAEIREKLFAPKVKLLESYQSLIDSKRAALDAIQNQPMHPNYKTLRAEVAQAEAGMAKIQAMGIDAPELLKAAREMGFSGTNLPQRKAK